MLRKYWWNEMRKQTIMKCILKCEMSSYERHIYESIDKWLPTPTMLKAVINEINIINIVNVYVYSWPDSIFSI